MQRRWMQVGCTVALLTLAGTSAASAAETPLQSTRAMIEAFKIVTPAPEDGTKLTAEQRRGNAAAFTKLDGFFDFDELVAQPIAPFADKLTPAQRSQFATQFRELIRLVAYPKSGTFFEMAEYKLKPQKAAGAKADVLMKAYLKKEDIRTEVTFHWVRTDGGWKIVDVSFDGASLVKDYRNQFGRIVNKEGVKGLIDRVAKRLATERETASEIL